MNRKISVIGLGYVGLPVAVSFGKKFKVIGYDINEKRLAELRKGQDSTNEVDPRDLKTSDIHFTSNPQDLRESDFHIVAVPTPINEAKQPDLTPLLSVTKTVGSILKPGDIVVYESTVYPGCTEEECAPILENQSGLTYINNSSCNLSPLVAEKGTISGFFLGYSPERINPSDKEHSLTKITKITSGSNDEVAIFVDELYNSILDEGTHKASSIAVAEAAKVIENIQRDVNIALINELSMLFNKLKLDTSEVLEAARSKWNFLPFRPGLVGGHCIGVDPYYLTHKAIEVGYNPEMILAGRRINDGMGKFIADSAITEMARVGINPVRAKVAIFGLTFKENCPDLRNTKVISIIENLNLYNCEVIVTDQYANRNEAKEIYNIDLVPFNHISNIDVAIVAVAHSEYTKIKLTKWEKIIKNVGVFIDIKSIYDIDYFNKSNISHWRL